MLFADVAAFSQIYGLIKYKVLPFRLAKNASEFMQVMNHLLTSNSEPRIYVAVNLDDILIHTQERQEHMDYIQTVPKSNLVLWVPD